MKCENPMLAVRVGDKFRFVGAVKDSDKLRNRKYLYSTENKIVVACGQCFACRMNRARDWASRCVLEAKAYNENCFITLTYDPNFLPADYGLVKKDFQDFMKRLRKNTGKKIRYYMCGEYGEKFGRPHYHAILFGYYPSDAEFYTIRAGYNLYTSEEVSKAWQYKGFVSVGDVTYDSACYVARYINKKLTGDKADEVYQGRQPPYNNMSLKPGIGASFMDKYSEDIYAKDFIVIRDNLKIKPPRYFDNIYDVYYGEGSFDECVKPARLERAEIRRNQNPEEYSFEAYTRQGRFQRVKRRNDRRDYVEE